MIDTREVSGGNTGDVTPASTLLQVRERIDELNDSVLELREEADKLLASARKRTIVALLDPPAPAPLPDEAAPVVDTPRDQDMAFGALAGTTADEALDETSAPSVPEQDAERRHEADNPGPSVNPELPEPASEWEMVDSDEALEKFFSDDVEPEPARRWLLTD